MNSELKLQKKIERLEKYDKVDMCACAGNMRCDGVCRDAHTESGVVNCPAVYQINLDGVRDQLNRLQRRPDNKKSSSEKERNRERFYHRKVD